jgi:hypothetical protein
MRRVQPVFLVLVIALWLPALAILGSLFGCQAGTTGLMRPLSPVVEHTITNTVAVTTQTAAAVLPVPFSTALEASGAAVLALLAAWQGLTHSKVKTLETNNPTTTTNVKS